MEHTVKKIANSLKRELPFISTAIISEANAKNELITIDDVGFVIFHHCKGLQTTIYDIGVLPSHQAQGYGRLLFYKVLCESIEKGKSFVQLKCPVDLQANEFYRHLGFTLKRVEQGKKRSLNVWRYYINLPLLIYCADGGRNHYSQIAKEEGWLLGMRSDQMEVKPSVSMIDNNWHNYNHNQHLQLIKENKPLLATARDIDNKNDVTKIIDQAREISNYCGRVLVIPKIEFDLSPIDFPFWLAYSVPSGYGKSDLPLAFFSNHYCHLLGGNPKKQAELSKTLNVVSLDSNYAMNVAKFGKSVSVKDTSGKKLVKGCYESFRLSMQFIRDYWSD